MYWYDGRLVDRETISLNISEPGLIYGATVFTTMRVYQHSLTHPLSHWQSHCDRLKQSIISFGWQQPDWQRLKTGVTSLLTYFPVIRIVIFPDGTEWITGRQLSSDLTTKQLKGITAWIATEGIYRRHLSSHKTGNYLGAYLALQKARQLQAQEAILIDSQANWLETSTGNLWGYKNGCWYTPALKTGILPGIARSHLLIWLQTQAIPVQENIWTPDFVTDLEAIAYSNCVVEIIPIKAISGLTPKKSEQLLTIELQDLSRYFQI
ncbi:MAG TPA: aminotransferase class IV [Xenococcaceae cyanobacterium]